MNRGIFASVFAVALAVSSAAHALPSENGRGYDQCSVAVERAYQHRPQLARDYWLENAAASHSQTIRFNRILHVNGDSAPHRITCEVTRAGSVLAMNAAPGKFVQGKRSN